MNAISVTPNMVSQENSISELHQSAREWAEAGFYVFPVREHGKKPLPNSHGWEDATTDLNQIDEWWGKNPNYNVACCPGLSDHVVLDSDPPRGEESLAALEASEGSPFPPTFMTQTPRGGRHRWYEGAQPSTAGKLGPNIDTRSRGGYILLPPSRVIDPEKGIDGAYEVATDLEIAPPPPWLNVRLQAVKEHETAVIENLDLPDSVARAERHLKHLVSEHDVAIEGEGGNDRTYRLACALQDFGLSEAKVLDLVLEHWNPECEPPWDDSELEMVVHNACNYAQNEAGSKGLLSPQEVFGHLATAVGGPEPRSEFYPYTIQEMRGFPKPTWLIKDMIPSGSNVMIFGQSGSYKSFLALDIIMSIASGRGAYGEKSQEPRDVVYIAGEGAIDMFTKRIPAWQAARDIPEENIKIRGVRSVPMIGRPEKVLAFIEEIKKHEIRPSVIVIDTLAISMAGLNENDSKDAGLFLEACHAIQRAFDCSTISIHHSGKDDTRGARGSSALYAGFDTVLEVKNDRATKTVTMHVRKQRDSDEREYPWTFEGKKIFQSLVFDEITLDDYRKLHHTEALVSRKSVAKSLQTLGAVGDDNAVTTAVLADTLTPQVEGQPDDERLKVRGSIERLLRKSAKQDEYAVYTLMGSHPLKWVLIPSDN